MIEYALMLAISQQKSVTTYSDSPSAWLIYEPNKTVASNWSRAKSDALLAVEYLRKDSPANRMAKIAQWLNQQVSDLTSYRACFYQIEFADELRQNGLFPEVISFTGKVHGNRDPEFQRVHYIVYAQYVGSLSWGRKGRQLHNIFPSDKRLQVAFIYDCRRNNTNIEDKLLGLTLVHKLESYLGKTLFYSHIAAVNESLFHSLKKDSYRLASIEGYKNYLKYCDESRKGGVNERIKKLEGMKGT